MVYSKRRLVLSLALCYIVLVFFSPFSIAIPRLGKRKLILVLFVCFFGLKTNLKKQKNNKNNMRIIS